jgi:uncharacterized protein YndB with AHSA1/START domain
MSNLHYTIHIDAPRELVYHTMLDGDTYRQWTSAFQEGCYFDGSWDEGSEIRFVSEVDGGKSGMLAKVAQNRPNEYVSLQQLGEIENGSVDVNSEASKKWQGAFENYTFTDEAGGTLLSVELIADDMPEDISKMFEEMWPQALQKLKDICESA